MAKQSEQVQEIPISELFPFKDHPFRVLDDEAMQRTVESISQFGVLAPAIARPRPEGGYEIIAGQKTSSVLFGSILWAKGIPKKIFRLSLRVRKSIVPESNLPWQKRNGHSIFCLSLMIKFGQKAPDISGGQPITILSRWRRPESFSKSMALTPWMSCVRKQAPLPQTSTELTKS